MAQPRLDPARHDFDLERRSAYRFSLIADLSMRCLAEMFTKRYGLTVSMWQVLAIIGRFQPMYPTDIASRAAMHPDKVTRTVDTLVSSGLVERTPDSADRRRIVLCLTRKGYEMHADIDHVRRVIESEFMSALTDAEIRAFNHCMDKLEVQARELFEGKDAWKRILVKYEPERLKPATKALQVKKRIRKMTM